MRALGAPVFSEELQSEGENKSVHPTLFVYILQYSPHRRHDEPGTPACRPHQHNKQQVQTPMFVLASLGAEQFPSHKSTKNLRKQM